MSVVLGVGVLVPDSQCTAGEMDDALAAYGLRLGEDGDSGHRWCVGETLDGWPAFMLVGTGDLVDPDYFSYADEWDDELRVLAEDAGIDLLW